VSTTEPLARRSSGDHAATYIKRLIFDQHLRPGDRVPQDDVAQALGISRIPVREALIALEREGWITIEMHRGAFVNDLDEQAVRDHYDAAVTLPTMSTGATDMAYLRAKGMQCYGIGPATDIEDGPKGFGAHSDQERILEAELHRFVRFHWDVVTKVAGRR